MKPPLIPSVKNKAVIYCRVSTKDQVENNSLESQEKECRKYCVAHELDIVEVFVEPGESAKTVNRHEFQRMLGFCQKNKGRISHLITYSTSRFSRNNDDYYAVKAYLTKMGIVLRCTSEPFDETPQGKFMAGVYALTSQLDNDLKSVRTIDTMNEARAKGHWLSKPPLGYRAGDKNFGASLIPDPERAEHVQKAFSMMATGIFSIQEVLKKLNLEGFKTRGGKPVSIQTFRQLLRKKAYIGKIVSQRTSDIFQGDFIPLIDENPFFRVQEILDGKTKLVKTYQKINPDFPLRNFVICGHCQKGFSGSHSKGRNSSYAYYTPVCRCSGGNSPSIRKERLESDFFAELEFLKPKQHLFQMVNKVIRDATKMRQKGNLDRKTTLKKKMDDLRKKRMTLDERFAFEKAIDQETYDRLKIQIQNDEGEIKAALYEIESELFHPDEVIQFAEVAMTNAASLWKDLPMPHKHRFQYLLFPRGVEYSDGKLKTADKSLIFSLLEKKNESEDGLVTLTGLEPVRQP